MTGTRAPRQLFSHDRTDRKPKVNLKVSGPPFLVTKIEAICPAYWRVRQTITRPGDSWNHFQESDDGYFPTFPLTVTGVVHVWAEVYLLCPSNRPCTGINDISLTRNLRDEVHPSELTDEYLSPSYIPPSRLPRNLRSPRTLGAATWITTGPVIGERSNLLAFTLLIFYPTEAQRSEAELFT
ncbi:hypothetical protein BV22DRAFT_1123657, partial [Leucogyrophana mollusca]